MNEKDFSPQLIPASQHKETPWKNGGGVTREIFIWPPESSVAENNFQWRLSRASITKSGPFSLFPGYERLLTVDDGGMLRLTGKNTNVKIEAGVVTHFSGDEQMDCELLGAPVNDLGLIYRVSDCHARMKNIAGARAYRTKISKGFTVIVNLGASVHATISMGEQIESFDLAAKDAAVLNLQKNDVVLSIESSPHTFRIVLITIA